jgi:hypothetical protein
MATGSSFDVLIYPSYVFVPGNRSYFQHFLFPRGDGSSTASFAGLEIGVGWNPLPKMVPFHKKWIVQKMELLTNLPTFVVGLFLLEKRISV